MSLPDDETWPTESFEFYLSNICRGKELHFEFDVVRFPKRTKLFDGGHLPDIFSPGYWIFLQNFGLSAKSWVGESTDSGVLPICTKIAKGG